MKCILFAILQLMYHNEFCQAELILFNLEGFINEPTIVFILKFLLNKTHTYLYQAHFQFKRIFVGNSVPNKAINNLNKTN